MGSIKDFQIQGALEPAVQPDKTEILSLSMRSLLSYLKRSEDIDVANRARGIASQAEYNEFVNFYYAPPDESIPNHNDREYEKHDRNAVPPAFRAQVNRSDIGIRMWQLWRQLASGEFSQRSNAVTFLYILKTDPQYLDQLAQKHNITASNLSKQLLPTLTEGLKTFHPNGEDYSYAVPSNIVPGLMVMFQDDKAQGTLAILDLIEQLKTATTDARAIQNFDLMAWYTDAFKMAEQNAYYTKEDAFTLTEAYAQKHGVNLGADGLYYTIQALSNNGTEAIDASEWQHIENLINSATPEQWGEFFQAPSQLLQRLQNAPSSSAADQERVVNGLFNKLLLQDAQLLVGDHLLPLLRHYSGDDYTITENDQEALLDLVEHLSEQQLYNFAQNPSAALDAFFLMPSEDQSYINDLTNSLVKRALETTPTSMLDDPYWAQIFLAKDPSSTEQHIEILHSQIPGELLNSDPLVESLRAFITSPNGTELPAAQTNQILTWHIGYALLAEIDQPDKFADYATTITEALSHPLLGLEQGQVIAIVDSALDIVQQQTSDDRKLKKQTKQLIKKIEKAIGNRYDLRRFRFGAIGEHNTEFIRGIAAIQRTPAVNIPQERENY